MLSWSYGENDELWQHDEFETEEECILDAKENYRMKPGEQIAIGTVCPYQVFVSAERILESIEEEAYEECGEVAENWNLFGKDNSEALDILSNELTDCVNRYLESIGEKPTFSKIDDIYTVTIN